MEMERDKKGRRKHMELKAKNKIGFGLGTLGKDLISPIWNSATNRISKAILAVEDAARNKKGVLESPSAEKIPLDTL